MSDKIELIPENIQLALGYSRNFATAKPNIGQTEKEHILGLANLLEKNALQLQTALAQQSAQAVPDGWRDVLDRAREGIGAGALQENANTERRHVEPYLDGIYDELEALEKDSAAPAAPVAVGLPDLPEQMARDLARFNETCEDGQEYDVPKERMRAMASFGLVRWCGGSRFEITDCGIAVLESVDAAAPAQIAHELLPDEIHQMAFEEGQPADNGDGYLFTAEEFDLFVERLLKRAAPPAAEQPDTVKVPRELLGRCLFAAGKACTVSLEAELRGLLRKEGEA